MVIQESMTVMEKLGILADAAKYDVACTSSGTARKGDGTGIGNSISAGICHSFAGDGRCISLLKVLYTNECVFDCKYCVNRASNDVVRASFTPEEISRLTIEFYRADRSEESEGLSRTLPDTSPKSRRAENFVSYTAILSCFFT